jgi:hypothetical protein
MSYRGEIPADIRDFLAEERSRFPRRMAVKKKLKRIQAELEQERRRERVAALERGELV